MCVCVCVCVWRCVEVCIMLRVDTSLYRHFSVHNCKSLFLKATLNPLHRCELLFKSSCSF